METWKRKMKIDQREMKGRKNEKDNEKATEED